MGLISIYFFQFMMRQEVLKLYREIFRTIRFVPDPSGQNELKEWARQDFRNNKDQNNEVSGYCRYNLGCGKNIF